MLLIILLLNTLCANSALKILVLGGTGFVGKRFIDYAIMKSDIEIVALSRRGTPLSNEKSSNSEYMNRITWIAGDAGDADLLKELHVKYGPFDACLHCIGLLFDSKSGLANLNKIASGSASQPDATSTYDKVTRLTAFNAIDAFDEGENKTFVFISAAEAAWTFKAPVEFLERYLTAKRAVESKLGASALRSVIFRPSLIWTSERPQGLLSVIPFYIGSTIGLPFVDRPVRVESLVKAIYASIVDPSVRGIQSYKGIDALAGDDKTCAKKARI